ILSFSQQSFALQHTKTVLFINDRQSQISERQSLLDKSMCSDHQRAFSTFDLLRKLLSRFFWLATNQKVYYVCSITEQIADVAEMLFGKDLGRHHEGDLKSIFDCDDC